MSPKEPLPIFRIKRYFPPTMNSIFPMQCDAIVLILIKSFRVLFHKFGCPFMLFLHTKTITCSTNTPTYCSDWWLMRDVTVRDTLSWPSKNTLKNFQISIKRIQGWYFGAHFKWSLKMHWINAHSDFTKDLMGKIYLHVYRQPLLRYRPTTNAGTPTLNLQTTKSPSCEIKTISTTHSEISQIKFLRFLRIAKIARFFNYGPVRADLIFFSSQRSAK